MRYTPSNIPQHNLRAWLADELRRIAGAMGPRLTIELAESGAEPTRARNGTIVYAVSPWADSLSGEGVYARVAGTWTKLH